MSFYENSTSNGTSKDVQSSMIAIFKHYITIGIIKEKISNKTLKYMYISISCFICFILELCFLV